MRWQELRQVLLEAQEQEINLNYYLLPLDSTSNMMGTLTDHAIYNYGSVKWSKCRTLIQESGVPFSAFQALLVIGQRENKGEVNGLGGILDALRMFIYQQRQLVRFDQVFTAKGNLLDLALDEQVPADALLQILNPFRGIGVSPGINNLKKVIDIAAADRRYVNIARLMVKKIDPALLNTWHDENGRNILQYAYAADIGKEIDYIFPKVKPGSAKKGSSNQKSHRKKASPASCDQQQLLHIHNSAQYQQDSVAILQSHGLQAGYTTPDGHCFYHAITALFEVSQQALTEVMSGLLLGSASGIPTAQQLVILETIA